MRTPGIARQFMLLVSAFAIATPAAIGGLAFVLYRNGAMERKTYAAAASQTALLFSVVESVGKVQSATQQLIREKDPDNIEKLLEQRRAAARIAVDQLRQADSGAGGLTAAFSPLQAAGEKVTNLVLKGDAAQAQESLVVEANPALERLLAAISQAHEESTRSAAIAVTGMEAASRRAQIAVFGLAGLMVAALAGFSAVRVRAIAAALRCAVDELRLVSEGGAAAALEISQSSQTLARDSSQQAAALEQTAASSEEISAMTRRNAGHSRTAADKTNHAASQVDEANCKLAQLVTSMNEINASGAKVSRIIRTIDEIAFQTNILALNAAVEAARAGEAGQSFAVVADEVRNLAQRCANAAQDTAALIEESLQKTRHGKTRLDEVTETVRSITASTGDVKTLMDQILSASDDQARGIQQISTALAQMEQVTQRAAATAEQSASAGERLASQSGTMESTVTRLATMVYGA